MATTPAFLLPRDVLAIILVRLPGADLRRLRRVCKEWRDIISDPTFIQEHVFYTPKLPPTHTMVFFPGFTYGSRQDPRNGRGFLFDEHWRLTAELTSCRWDDLIGTCNGLLCFLESGQGSIKIIEPFTGESLALPQPPERSSATYQLRRSINPSAYCFGFDAMTRRYKIVYHGYLKSSSPPDDEELHVCTVGGGKGWTRVNVDRAVHGNAYGNPFYVDGAVYWPTRTYVKCRLARFDLATEKITSKTTVHLRLDPPRSEKAVYCRLVDASPCVMTYGSCCEWDAWFPEAEEGGAGCFAGGRVLLILCDPTVHGLYLRRIDSSLEFGPRMLLFEVGMEQKMHDYKYNGRASFVPARRHQQLPIPGAPPVRKQCYARTFRYAPTVSAAPLALYLGTPSP